MVTRYVNINIHNYRSDKRRYKEQKLKGKTDNSVHVNKAEILLLVFFYSF